jgi:aspartyl protease family protein
MLKHAIFAVVSAVSAMGAAKAVVALDDDRRAPEHHAAVAQAAVVQVGGAPAGAASIAKASDGHYWAEAEVDGRRVRFLVDTGASAVALTLDDARRLGIDPKVLAYEYGVQTANGEARAALVKLASVTVAGARVKDVDAFVIEKGLETSLLGMSYLGRLSRFEATPGALILRQ